MSSARRKVTGPAAPRSLRPSGMPAHPAPVTDSSQLPRPQPSKQPQKNPPKRTNQPEPSDASTTHERAPAAQRASVNPCFAPFFPAPRQLNGSAAPAAKQASQELGPAGRQCSSSAEEQHGSQKAAAAPGVRVRANGRTDRRAPVSPSSTSDSQADCGPENSSSPAQPEAPGMHAMPPQQCPPLFPDARGPCTVLDLMPKDWARPFSGWACAYDASLGISHASQAYIRRMQRLRRGQPSMRRGAPQFQLHFSSWEVQMLYKAGRRAGNDGDYPECRTKLLEAKMQEPYSIRILNDLATVVIAMQGYAEADVYMSTALILNSQNVAGLRLRAQARTGYGHYRGAMEDLKTAHAYACSNCSLGDIEQELAAVQGCLMLQSDADQHRFADWAAVHLGEAGEAAEHALKLRAEHQRKRQDEEDAMRASKKAKELLAQQKKSAKLQQMSSNIKAHEFKEQLRLAQLRESFRAENMTLQRRDLYGHEFWEVSPGAEGSSGPGSLGGHSAEGAPRRAGGEEEAARAATSDSNRAKLLLDAYRKKTAARLDKIPGLVIQRQQRLKADLAAIDQFLSDSLPDGQGIDELTDPELAEMLGSGRPEHNSRGQRRSSRWIADEELRQEYDRLAELQGKLPDMDLDSCKVSNDRRGVVQSTSSTADSRLASAGLSSSKPASKASATEVQSSADAAKGRPEPDQAAAGKQPKSGSSKKKKGQKKGSKVGPVEGVTARGITEEQPAAGQPAPGLGFERPRSAPGLHEQGSTHDGVPAGQPSPAHCNADNAQGDQQPSPEAKALPLHMHASEQKQDADAGGMQAEVPGDGLDSTAAAEGPQAPLDLCAAAEPEIASGQGFSTTDAEQAERFHASLDNPADLEVEEADESFHDANSGAGSAVSSAAPPPDVGSCPASAEEDPKWSPMGAETRSNSEEGEDAEQYFAAPEEELPKAPALTNDWSEERSSPEAHAALGAASAAISAGSYKEALGHCEEALRLEPSSMRARLCQAEASLLLGRIRMCAAHYDWALDLSPDLPSGERTRHFCLVLDAMQKLLGEASGARLDEAEKLLSPLQKLAHQDEHQAKVLYIESYLRLRKANLPPDFAQLGPFERLSEAQRDLLMGEAKNLLEEDQEIVLGLVHDCLPAIVAYRKVMTDAAKSAGNECTRSGNHTWGMEFYSLAIFLDASNLAALCNRANSYHMLGQPERTVEDATKVLVGLEAGAVRSKEAERKLQQKALYRRGRAHYELGEKTGHAPHYLSAFDDLTALSHPNESATELLGLCHGHILQHGGQEALARLGAATASKTGPVRHTPEALAAMGETGAGLSLAQMARHLSSASAPDRLGTQGSGAHADTQGEQQQLLEALWPPIGTNLSPIVDLPLTWRQRARSSFRWCYPKAEKQEQPLNSVKGSSDRKHSSCESPGGIQHEQSAIAQGPSTAGPNTQHEPAAAAGTVPQSSSAAGNPAHARCRTGRPDQAEPSSQLSAADTAFIAETVCAAELINRLVTYPQTGPLKLRHEELATIRSLNAVLDPQAAIQSILCRVQTRAEELAKSGRPQDAGQLLEAFAARTGWIQGYAHAAKWYHATDRLSAAKRCMETAVAADERSMQYQSMLIGVHEKLGDHASLAVACTKVLKHHSGAHMIRELRALANYRLGKHALYCMDVKKLGKDPEWQPIVPELAAVLHQDLMDRDNRKGKGKRMK